MILWETQKRCRKRRKYGAALPTGRSDLEFKPRFDERLFSLALPLVYKATGRRHMRMLDELIAHESLDAQELDELQFGLLRKLLEHCYESVPYYRRRFDEIDAKPDDIKSLDDYAKFPVLTKEMLKDNMDSLVATNFNRSRLVPGHTGGSTGTPIRFYQDKECGEWGSAAFLRNLMWTGHRLGERQVWLWGVPTSEKTSMEARLKYFFTRRWALEVGDLSEKTMAQWTEAIARIGPRMLYGYPSAVSALAGYLEASSRRIDGISQVVVSSEVLLPENRALIERAFRARVFDQYGSREVFSIASECRSGSKHMNSDLNVVEFASETQESAAAGSKDLVLTPLFAYGMPLLRYANGDFGAPLHGRCDCGMALPRMDAVVGRTLDSLLLSDGSVIHGHLFLRQIHGIPGIRRFQLCQTVPGTVELRVVRDEGYDEDSQRRLLALERTIERENRVRMKITLCFVDEIPLTALGKHKYVVCEPLSNTSCHGVDEGEGDSRREVRTSSFFSPEPNTVMRLDERVSAALLPHIYRATGRDHMRMLGELISHESLDAEQLAGLQLSMLRRLVEHCYANVPYYRTLFDGLGTHPDDIKSLADYARLPVLTKELLKDNGDALVATNFDRKSLRPSKTGGSTGAPVQFFQDKAYCEWGSAGFIRNLTWTGYRLGQRHVYFWGFEMGSAPSTIERSKRFFLRRRVFDAFTASDETMAEWADVLRRFRPETLYGYCSTLSFFADYLERSGTRIDGVRRIITSGEMLLKEQRELLSRVFGCGVFSQYGSREVWSIASECRCGAMHVNNDLNVVEFEDLSEDAAACGSKDIVVTPLLAYGMPLLRYVNGDAGEPVAHSCDCGLPFPAMHTSVGRTTAIFTLPGGATVHGLYFVRLVYGTPGIGRFQFQQTAPDLFELRIVKDSRFSEDTTKALSGLEERAAKDLGVRIRIPVTFVDEIPLTRMGKHKFTVADVPVDPPVPPGE